jgi:hypothetical protein
MSPLGALCSQLPSALRRLVSTSNRTWIIERAAIREFDGGMSPADAETLAAEEVSLPGPERGGA